MLLSDNCPCKGCEDRYPVCHSSCEGYIEWRKKLDERNQLIKEEKRQRSSAYVTAGRRKK